MGIHLLLEVHLERASNLDPGHPTWTLAQGIHPGPWASTRAYPPLTWTHSTLCQEPIQNARMHARTHTRTNTGCTHASTWSGYRTAEHSRGCEELDFQVKGRQWLVVLSCAAVCWCRRLSRLTCLLNISVTLHAGPASAHHPSAAVQARAYGHTPRCSAARAPARTGGRGAAQGSGLRAGA